MRTPTTTRAGRRYGDPRRDGGQTIVIVAVAMLALLIIAALVVDLGGAYSWKRKVQNVADFAALAGARQLPGNPPLACAAAWNYLEANLSDLPGGAASPCGGFATTCTPGGAGVDYAASAVGPYTIRFRYPVPDGDGMLGSSRTEDGTNPCERIGVTVDRVSPAFFSPSFGGSVLKPKATAVARHTSGYFLEKVANLVVLDPTGCVDLSVQGTGTQVLVGTDDKPGAIAVDSDGTDSAGPNSCAQRTTIATGGGAELMALPITGQTPGEIRLYAQPGNQVTCAPRACLQTDVGVRVFPQPQNLRARVTRAVVDQTYNCKPSYPDYHGIQIEGCDQDTAPYIDDLVDAVSPYDGTAPPGWVTLTGPDCNPKLGAPPISGNVWVDCKNFSVNNGVTVDFTSGNVIFTGDVSVAAGGVLKFNSNSDGSSPPKLSDSCLTSVCLNASSQAASFVYLLNGNLVSTGANSSLVFDHAFLYVTAGDQNFVRSASGASQSWSAPTEGPFEDLALWAESQSSQFQLTGGGNSSIDGVFFTPEATFTIAGGFTNPQTAQFLSYHLAVTGGSLLQMTPDEDRLLHTSSSGSILIR